MDVAAVDLFCGTGGMSLGLERAGLDARTGVDVEISCRYPYERNTDGDFLEADVSSMDRRELEEAFGTVGVRVLAGCAPCQPFSGLNPKEESTERDDWGLMREMGRLVRRVRPEVVVVENVVRMRQHSVYARFLDALRKSGYEVSVNEVHCPDYGVPQTRNRLVVLASRLGAIELADPTHSDDPADDRDPYRTVRDAIGDLPPIEAGEVHPDDRLHRAADLEEENRRRLEQMPQGGNVFDLDPEIRQPRFRDLTPGDDGFTDVCGRLDWDEPAPTVTTEFFGLTTGRTGHPEQDRALSLREGARLQTFPDEYTFLPEDGEVTLTEVGRLVGNAVPPRLAAVVGESVLEHLEQVGTPAPV